MIGDLQAGFIVGEYKIEKKIGEGGMGSVYSAMHPMIGKRAAIKVISAALGADASAVGRFVQEARSVNQIGHPNIVDVFAFGELPDGRNYFVMEYLQGESLADRLHRGALPLGEAIEILDQVCDALEAAHEKQIVHRDLKPDNVYLAAVRGNRTMVKLLDFGIAKLSVADGPGSQGGIAKTRTGMMMGTPGYISPEQARGKNVDHRTDVYALGAMAFEIVTGRLPFVADNAMDIVLAHMVEPPPRPSQFWPEVPPQLDETIYRMLNKDPAQRPTLAEARASFSELVSSGLVTLAGGRGVAFGSQIGRLATPAHGVPTPGLAVGTKPATIGPGQLASSQSTPGMDSLETPKKKTGLIVGLLAVAVLGGGGAFLALGGGGDDKKQEPPPTVASNTPPDPTKDPNAKTVDPPKDPPKDPVGSAGSAATDPPKDPPKDPVEAPKVGTLTVELTVDKGTLTIDDKPITLNGRKAEDIELPPGKHKIVAAAPGYNAFEEEIEVKAGRNTTFVAKLDRARSGTSGSGKKNPTGTGKKNPTGTTPAGTGAGSGTKHKDDTIDPFAK